MTADEVKTALGKAVRRAWPRAAKASELPFPDYWKGATEWLAFHAPHIGDELMGRFIADIVREAVCAEAAGTEPAARKISDEVKEIWNRAVADAAQDAWEHAAERAEEVRSRFAARRLHDGNLEGKNHDLNRSAQRSVLTDRPKSSACGGRPERRPYQGRLL